MALSATLVRTNAPSLKGFWTKNIEFAEPQRGRPLEDVPEVLRQEFGRAAEYLGQALAKGPAAEALGTARAAE
jgi:hypothetical protein